MNAMTPQPLITIGITCFNAKDTIQRSVQSALHQTWRNFEILLVDDGSSDGSWDIIQSLKTAYPNIRLLRHETNSGFPCALNTLLQHAKGEFIAFFDDDDESLPERLEQQYQRIITYEETHEDAIVFCYSNRDVVRSGETTPTFKRRGIGRTPPEPSGPIVADYILGLLKEDRYHCWGMFGSCTLMARTESFRQLGGFDPQFRRCTELDFATRAAFLGAHFISVDSTLITQHLTDTPDKSGKTDLIFRLLLLKEHKAYLKSRRAYWGAVAKTHAKFYQASRVRRILCYAFALILFPWPITREMIKHSGLYRSVKMTFRLE